MVMRAMLDAIEPLLKRGAVVHAATVQAKVPEGRIAEGLEKVQRQHKDLAIGSYPYYREDGPGVQLVARGRDKADVETAAREIEALLRELGVEPARVGA
jgi:molybdopterin-biosynthesis enzyme MoeA-like protein